jgi:hypothetical protein
MPPVEKDGLRAAGGIDAANPRSAGRVSGAESPQAALSPRPDFVTTFANANGGNLGNRKLRGHGHRASPGDYRFCH